MAPVVDRRRSLRARRPVDYDVIGGLFGRRRRARSLDGVSNINQNEPSRKRQTRATANPPLDGVNTNKNTSGSNVPGTADSKRSNRIRVKVSPRPSSSSSDNVRENSSVTTPSTVSRSSRIKGRLSTLTVASKNLRQPSSSMPRQTRTRLSVEGSHDQAHPSGPAASQVGHLLSPSRNVQSDTCRASKDRAMPFSRAPKPSPMLCEATKRFSPKNLRPCRSSTASSMLHSST